jgi:hypothetical protein
MWSLQKLPGAKNWYLPQREPCSCRRRVRDVERNGYQIPDFEKLDTLSFFNHFSGDLMAEDKAGRSGGPSPHHMLVTATDIG